MLKEKGIPAIKKQQDVVLASHTGSGKTLSYLLPVVGCAPLALAPSVFCVESSGSWMLQIELLKNQEEKSGVDSKMKRPRAIVLGPTRELTDQVTNTRQSLGCSQTMQ